MLHCLNKKNIAAAFFGLLLIFPLWSGTLSGYSEIKILQTKYFDIIFPTQSRVAAQILAENADLLYQKACDFLGSEPYFRMPVVITPCTDQLNAYFTLLPYNRIVVYDVPPSSSDGASLAVFSETLQSVFYHEVVHAVSLNMKSGFWKGLSLVFGDYLSPAMLNMTTMFSEGVTVSLESMQGEGRLNDGFSMHIVRQAKLENCFPSWRDTLGSRDIYPIGSVPYMFGGAFANWLQQTYGMEKYSEFLYECGKLHLFFTSGAFEKVYGLSIKNAWRKFKESIILPYISANPTQNQGINTFPQNEDKGLFRSLTSFSGGVAWIDSLKEKISFLPTEHFDSEKEKPETLLNIRGLTRISFATNGRFMALSQTISSGVEKNRVAVLHIPSKKIRYVAAPHLRDGTIVQLADGFLYVAAVEAVGQVSTIKFYRIFETKENDFSISSSSSYDYAILQGSTAYNLVDCGGGKLGFIGGSLANNLSIFDPVSGNCYSFSIPKENLESFSIRSVAVKKSFNEKNDIASLIFSWAGKDTFPRLGTLDISFANNTELIGVFNLSEMDSSGGVFSPVPFFTSEPIATKILYSAHFYSYDNLFVLDANSLKYKTYVAKVAIIAKNVDTKNDSSSFKVLFDYGTVENYNPLLYALHGALFPVSIVQEYNQDFEILSSAVLGATWLTSDPAETAIVMISGGYSPVAKKWGLGANVSAGAFTVDVSGIFSGGNFSSAVADASVGLSFPVGRISDIKFGDNGSAYIGNDIDVAEDFIFSLQNNAFVQFSTIRSGGRGYFNHKGLSLAFQLNTVFSSDDELYNNLTFVLKARVPGYVPLHFGVQLFPKKNTALDYMAQAYLYTFEVQKGVPILGLYLNRLAFSFGYAGQWNRENYSWDIFRSVCIMRQLPEMSYQDRIFVRLTTQAAINATMLVGSGFSVHTDFSLYLHNKPEQPKFDFSLAVDINL